MSTALLFGLAGLAGGIAQLVVLSRVADGMKQKQETAGTGRLLQTIAWVDLLVLPVAAYVAGSFAGLD